MLTHPTLDQLHQLGLFGMAKAFGDAEASTEAAALTHPEWLALLLDREVAYRHDRKLAARLRYARLCQRASKFPRLWAFNFPYFAGLGSVGDQPFS